MCISRQLTLAFSMCSMDYEKQKKKKRKEFEKRLLFLINHNDFIGAADHLSENYSSEGSK